MDDRAIRARVRLARACRMPEAQIVARILSSPTAPSKDRVLRIAREVYAVDYETTYAMAMAATLSILPHVETLGERAVDLMEYALGKA
jgi:hypothetical protein